MPKVKRKDETKYSGPESPFCIQIEMAEGCNLRCSFCGLNGIRGKENDFKFMELETAESIAEQLAALPWNPRIEFAMHGEPSMHPDFIEILYVFRHNLPKHHLMMTSNGGGFVRNPVKLVNEAMESLNVLALDNYENVKIVPKIIDKYRKSKNQKHQIRNYPIDKEANPHVRRKPSEKLLVVVQDIQQADKGTHATLNNHAGCGAPINDNGRGKRCAKPFREMSIRWDGNVAVCCNDWRGIYQCGNVIDESIEDVWLSDSMDAARRKLYLGQRDFGPCNGCDATSYRVGFLPDKKGKQVMPKPTKETLRIIESSCNQSPYTLPVLRDWER